ncbi:MAG: ATP-binding protein [Actinobacteria bacterium]|nr:ATP-binding protein [Actinomycetota bacterium]
MTLHARDEEFVIAIEDDGPGIAVSERERIFERFARGSASRNSTGSGLGLAIVAEHARALGGSATVENSATGGARFIVTLARRLQTDDSAWSRAFSRRLTMMRSIRRRSRRPVVVALAVEETSKGTVANPYRFITRPMKSARSTSSKLDSLAPASMRDSSRRSITVRSNRLTCEATMSIAWRLRSVKSSRRATMTSTAAASAVTGLRSSWLTSLAKRCSRSIRACTASAMSLNESTSWSRSGSSSGSSRVSSRPVAMVLAAFVTRASGRSAVRLMMKPRKPAAMVMRITPARSVVWIVRRVVSTSSSGNASKYWAPSEGIATPTPS